MKRATLLLTAALFLTSAATFPLSSQSTSEIPEIIVIQVSPQTLNLDWNTQGDPEVTVHAEVPYSDFIGGGLNIWLGGVQAEYIKSDARGELVAKFSFDQVIDSLGAGYVTLTLEAWDVDGNYYIGTDEVRLILR